jgi:uncharacterized protein (TIGR02453 family)
MSKAEHFTPALFKFFRELAGHNQRPWFLANQARYEAEARDPALRLIAAFAPRLKKISARFVADPRPNGGSLMRIYRDTRFAKDKSPYKTHLGISFRHADGDEGAAPGFYLHVGAEGNFCGAGLWHPAPPALGRIRDAMVAAPAKWRQAIAGLTLDGDSLARPPRGFDADHPLIADLKRKDFITGTEFSEREVCAPDFLDRFTRACERAAPLVGFVTRAVGLKF